MGRISFDLRNDPGRLGDLPCNDEDVHMFGHGFHLSDAEAERPVFGSDEAFEVCFNFSIYQFLSVFRTPYYMVSDIVHAVC